MDKKRLDDWAFKGWGQLWVEKITLNDDGHIGFKVVFYYSGKSIDELLQVMEKQRKGFCRNDYHMNSGRTIEQSGTSWQVKVFSYVGRAY